MNEEKKKKRSFAIAVMVSIMTFALCITLISCGREGDVKQKNIETTIITEKNVAEGEAVKAESEVADDGNEETQKTTSYNQKPETKATQKNATKVTQKSTTEPSTQKATTEAATQAKNVCYISIEGYCSGKEISLQGGDTAYSILTRSGATVSGSGNYIKGINGRFEFDEGPTSGWIYYVNGSRPAMGCGNCSIKAGDSISWDYVSKF